MAALVLSPLPGAGWWMRLHSRIRSLVSRRLLLSLVGVETVMLQGRVHVLRAVPLGVARELVPAIIRCSRRFEAWQLDEVLFDDIVKVLSLGLRTSPAEIERLRVSLFDIVPVIDRIARVNGLPVAEAGSAQGKVLAAMMNSTGTSSMPSSSPPPDGHGTT